MARLFNKYLLLAVLSYFVYVTLDLSSPELVPVKNGVTNLWNQVQSNQYYTDYITPAQEQITPYYTNYVSPSYSKAHGVFWDKYNVYASHHVSNIVSKVVDSPVYEQILSFKPQFNQYWTLVETNVKYFNNLTIRYVVVGIDKSYTYITTNFQIAKPLAVDFYNKKAVPFTQNAHVKSLEFLVIAKIHANRAYIAGKRQLCHLHKTVLLPLYNEKVVPVVQPLYDQHLKAHVETVSIQSAKYYALFKVEKILSFLQKYYSLAYQQVVKYGSGDSLSNINKNSTVATTETGTALETEVAEDPEITPNAEVDEDALEAPESEIPEDTEVETPVETVVETVTEVVEEVIATETEEQDQPIETEAKDIQTKAKHDGELTVSLADEITAWRSFIDTTVDNIFKNFNRSVDSLQSEKVELLKPIVKGKLSNLSNTAQHNYVELNKVILDINSTSAILDNGEEVEINEDGKLIDHKISRQEIRDYFEANSKQLKKIADSVNNDLRSFVSKVEDELEVERKLIVDIFEEFAEVAIDEFSKKMMYSTFSNSFRKINNQDDDLKLHDDDENFSDWKQYVKAKNHLIKKREELIELKPEFKILEKQISEVGFHLKTLEQETGSAFAIARAKANLAFQFREARERALEEALENGEEITQTILRYNTATLGDDGIITPGSNTNTETPVETETASETETETEVEPTVDAKVDVPVRNYADVDIDAEDELDESLGSSTTTTDTDSAAATASTTTSAGTTVVEDAQEDDTVADEEDEEETEDGDDSDEELGEDEETEETQDEDEIDEDIVEHEPDSEDNEEEDNIVEHKPDTP